MKRALLAMLLWCVQSAAQAQISLDELYQAWPKPVAEQGFEEARFDALLELTSRYAGLFRFVSLQHFEMVYTAPISGQLALHDGQLQVDLPGRKLQIALAQLPDVAQFIEPLQWLMQGQPQKLQQQYASELFWQDNTHWQLHLKPKGQSSLNASQIVVSGVYKSQQAGVERIRLEMRQGDWREFSLLPASAAITGLKP
jgi:hypothetical protein